MSQKIKSIKSIKPTKLTKTTKLRKLRKLRRTTTRKRRGGETDAEVRERRKREVEQKKRESMQKGTYLKPYNNQLEGDIVNQNLDYAMLDRKYKDNIDYLGAEMDGVTFGGKSIKSRKSRKLRQSRKNKKH